MSQIRCMHPYTITPELRRCQLDRLAARILALIETYATGDGGSGNVPVPLPVHKNAQ